MGPLVVRRQLPEALVRAGLVIVAEELAKDALKVTGTEDENVIQKLPSHRAHPALGEGCAELRVPVTKQKLGRKLPFLEPPGQVVSCCTTQSLAGLAVQPAKWTRRVPISMKNST